MARPSRAAYGMARYGAIVALKLMTRPSTSPPTRPIMMDDPTTEASPVAKYWDHGQSAPASSTTRSRNALLIEPCSVMRSPPTMGRGWLEKVFSFNPGLPDRDTGRGSDISSSSQGGHYIRPAVHLRVQPASYVQYRPPQAGSLRCSIARGSRAAGH